MSRAKVGQLTLCCCLLAVCQLRGEDRVLESGAPADVGMSAEVLRQGVRLFERAVEQDDLRGAVLLVARHGKVILHEAIGWRNKEEALRMEKDTLFKLASNTKPVIATAILMLIEQEKLHLDDNVRKHIPAWDNYRAGFIKIRHLLSHTSGLRIPVIFYRPLIQRSEDYPHAPSLRAEVDRFGRIGAEELPGTTYRYSNAGYNTLGRLVEVASEMSLKDFLRQNIYLPLGMHASWNHETDAPSQRMGRVYRRSGDRWRIEWSPGDGPVWPFPRGSGGMIASAEDYAVFCQMYLNGGLYGGRRVLSAEHVASATAVHTRSVFPSDEQTRLSSFYGLGWAVERDMVFGHGGSNGTQAWVDPREDLIVLVFTQSPGGRNPRDRFRQTVYDAIDARGSE